jgi:hypothetical protein
MHRHLYWSRPQSKHILTMARSVTDQIKQDADAGRIDL